MKRRVWSTLPVLAVMTLFPSRTIAGNEVNEIFGNIFNQLGDRLIEELDRDLERNRVMGEQGYCQVWRGRILAVQGNCRHERQCDQIGNCVNWYVWPSGGRTEVFFQNGSPITINGQPTAFVQVGPDLCFVDHPPGNNFCYTYGPQPANLRVLNAQRQRPVKHGDEMRSGTAEAQVRSGNAPTIPEQNNDDVDTLLTAYVTALENKDDPAAKKHSCNIGIVLVSEHADELDGKIEEDILVQLDQDGCLD